jgi:hypothetical protein
MEDDKIQEIWGEPFLKLSFHMFFGWLVQTKNYRSLKQKKWVLAYCIYHKYNHYSLILIFSI